MKKGDRVTWTSQSRGSRTVKFGRIVAVVPPKMPAWRFAPAGFRSGSPLGFGMVRNHETYLIKVDGKGRGLYWPRVTHLKLG